MIVMNRIRLFLMSILPMPNLRCATIREMIIGKIGIFFIQNNKPVCNLYTGMELFENRNLISFSLIGYKDTLQLLRFNVILGITRFGLHIRFFSVMIIVVFLDMLSVVKA